MSLKSDLKNLADKTSSGPWKRAKVGNAIISETENAFDADVVRYYGGFVVCETIYDENSDFVIFVKNHIDEILAAMEDT